MFTRAKVDAAGARPKYHQLNALLDYYFSKRTDVYLMGIYQQAAGGAHADVYDGATGQPVVHNTAGSGARGDSPQVLSD